MRDQEIIDLLSPLFGGVYKVLSTDCIEDVEKQIGEPIFWEASKMLIDYLNSGLSNSSSLPVYLVDWVDSHILDRLVEYKSENTHASLMTLCMYNNLNLVRWVVENIPVNLTNNWYCYFRWACSEGCLETAKYLFSKHPEIDLTIDRNYCMTSACEGGYLETVKWLDSLNPNTLCVNALISSLEHPKVLGFILSRKRYDLQEIERAVRYCCEGGFNESLKLLFNQYPEVKNSSDRDKFLHLAGIYGHVETASFLSSKIVFSPEAYADTFLKSVMRGHRDISLFLKEKFPQDHQVYREIPQERRHVFQS